VVSNPAVYQFQSRPHFLLVFRRIGVNRDIETGITVLFQNDGQEWVSLKEKTVCHNLQVRPGPTPARQRHKLRQVRMNRGFATQHGKVPGIQPVVPQAHPMFRVCQGQNSLVPLVGIMGAALACQIAGMDEMNFQVGDVPRPGRFPPQPIENE